MKGYNVKNGRVMMTEKNGRAVGNMSLANGIEAQINIVAGQASLIRLEIVSRILDAFSYAIKDVNRPLRVGPFAYWYDNGWNFTTWDEVPAWLQENE
jgi:hypothetical protein